MTKRKVTIAELERLLERNDNIPFEILPSGEIRETEAAISSGSLSPFSIVIPLSGGKQAVLSLVINDSPEER